MQQFAIPERGLKPRDYKLKCNIFRFTPSRVLLQNAHAKIMNGRNAVRSLDPSVLTGTWVRLNRGNP
jgi:hypothetical protein